MQTWNDFYGYARYILGWEHDESVAYANDMESSE